MCRETVVGPWWDRRDQPSQGNGSGQRAPPPALLSQAGASRAWPKPRSSPECFPGDLGAGWALAGALGGHVAGLELSLLRSGLGAAGTQDAAAVSPVQFHPSSPMGTAGCGLPNHSGMTHTFPCAKPDVLLCPLHSCPSPRSPPPHTPGCPTEGPGAPGGCTQGSPLQAECAQTVPVCIWACACVCPPGTACVCVCVPAGPAARPTRRRRCTGTGPGNRGLRGGRQPGAGGQLGAGTGGAGRSRRDRRSGSRTRCGDRGASPVRRAGKAGGERLGAGAGEAACAPGGPEGTARRGHRDTGPRGGRVSPVRGGGSLGGKPVRGGGDRSARFGEGETGGGEGEAGRDQPGSERGRPGGDRVSPIREGRCQGRGAARYGDPGPGRVGDTARCGYPAPRAARFG